MSRMKITYGAEKGPCRVCGAEGRACARCLVDFYCGKLHQTQDWPRHKRGCGALEVREDARFGRYAVAAKDIPAGTVLMRELPLVTFPTSWHCPGSDNQPFSMCVSCGVELLPLCGPEQCARCGWPVCGKPCSLSGEHRAECEAFQRAGFKLRSADASALGSRLDALTALRVCLAAKAAVVGPIIRNLPGCLPDLKANLEGAGPFAASVREGQDKFRARVDRAVTWLYDVAKVRWLPREELAHGLSCALLHGLEGTSGEESHLVGGVFAGLSLAGHACYSNAWRYASRRGSTEMLLVASRDIPRGERVTTNFMRDPLNPKYRREFFALTWGFLCRCTLCEDPSQLGLNLDSWHCRCWEHTTCSELVAVLDGVRWRCAGCGCEGAISPSDGEAFLGGILDAALGGVVKGNHFLADGRVMLGGTALDGAQGAGYSFMLEELFQQLLSERESTIAQWEELIQDALPPNGPLHPTHHLVLRAKRQILCPDTDGVERDIVNLKLRIPKTMKDAQTLAKHGRDLLAAVEVLRPGINHCRADLLRQLVVLSFTRMTLFASQFKQNLWRRQQDEWKAMVEEFAKQMKDLKTISVSPYEREIYQSLAGQNSSLLRSKLHPVLRKGALVLETIF
ncbi:SET domain-containing protein SmydA-8-like [Frankliniella occidentalis]|uniref:SET domain-containing protein SmydA-8-like n=1 Tax=Frankliniella occidentalis TaxID=133901 RepID=A0A9C6X4C0_FRAOC|nr:SET domain-containing protein SmydA-8-like [Frankliniella occidentalis]